MAQTVLHFVFTPSGAGLLRQALRKAGRNDQLISSAENLSYGPINPVDGAARAEWIEEELGESRWGPDGDSSDDVWNEARFPDKRRIAWLTRRCAREYAGFLNWLWRIGDIPFEVVDLSEVTVARLSEAMEPPKLAMSLGMLHHDIIRRDELWGLAKSLPAELRQKYLDLWQQLRSENAPLRITDGKRLVSAPITFFDSLLISQVTGEWRKTWHVLGQALVGDRDDIIGPDNTFLKGRIKALVRSGRLELQGELDDVPNSRLRLA